jgi:hypothetical protein
MEVTPMLDALHKLQAEYETPPSHLEILRRALQERVARMGGTEMPPILTDEQRKAFADKIGYLAGFLESEDGADAVELLLNAGHAYCAREEAESTTEEVPA